VRVQLPAEFIGRARALYRRVQAVDQATEDAAIAAVEPIYKALNRRPTRKPLRPETVAEAVQRWRALPEFGRMSRSITTAGRRATIIEVRAITGKLHDLRWRADDWESGIHLAQMRLEIEPHDVKLRQRSIAVVSLHSLARRFERSADRSDAGVLRDLARLAAADPDAMAPGAFSWQVEGAGGSANGSSAKCTPANRH
jgi:hypothetical protein